MYRDACKMKFTEKCYWLIYYYRRTPKGRFELSHMKDLAVLLAICIAAVEGAVYLWLNG